jgi:hypothetical protein
VKPSVKWTLLLIASAAGAQAPSAHAPDGNSFQRLASISVPTISGAPFTLTLSTQWTRRLSDGSTITLINHQLIARDSSGRVFQERRWLVPANDPNADRVSNLQWSDPEKGEYYDCLTATLVCQVDTYRPIADEVPAVPGPTMGGKGFVTVRPLGTRNIEGMETQGTVETTTINAGAIGNDQPIVITKEFWFSPELKLNLVVKREDPRSGTQIFSATNLVTGDPKPWFFEMPSGFRRVDHRRTVQSGAQQQ